MHFSLGFSFASAFHCGAASRHGVCMMMAMMITTLLLTKTGIPSNLNMMYEVRLLTMQFAKKQRCSDPISINACAALLLLQLLAFVFATVLTVVLNVTVDCTVAVAVAVLVTVMFLLWTHAMTLISDIDNVDMT